MILRIASPFSYLSSASLIPYPYVVRATRSQGRLDCRVVVIVDLLDIHGVLLNNLEDLQVSADLRLLHVCQGFRGSLFSA